MKLTKCENKHFYDGDEYESCPHCVDQQPEQGSFGLTQPDGNNMAFASEDGTLSLYTYENGGQSIISRPMDEPQTIPEEQQDIQPHMQSQQLQQLPQQQQALQQAPTPPFQAQQPPNIQPIAKEPEKSSFSNEAGTVYFYENAEEEPVTGWLVCVKGAYLGKSFPIKAGRNNIGRSMEMDIPLTKEVTISRVKHASVTYDPANCKFLIQPGEGRGLSYLNGEMLISHAYLNEYDKITLGKSMFVFIPLCGDKFNWDDYLN